MARDFAGEKGMNLIVYLECMNLIANRKSGVDLIVGSAEKKRVARKLKCWFTSEFKECRKFNCDRAVKTVRTQRGSGSAIIQLEFAVST